MLLVICLSVCLSHSLPRIPFVYTVLERRSSSDFIGILLLALVNGDVILTKIKKQQRNENAKIAQYVRGKVNGFTSNQLGLPK